MPSPFDITVASNTVNLDNKREGIATFTVKNNTRRRIRATAKVTAQPTDGEKWLSILPPEAGGTDTASVRDFPIDSTQQYQVRIAVPMEAPPSSYTMKLTLADEVNPDENFTESQDVIFTVREIPKVEPRPFPMWIIPVVIIALLVIGGIIFFAVKSANDAANANATSTAVALLDARHIAETQTAVAAALTEEATQNAIGTQIAVETQHAIETQIALGTQNAVGTLTAIAQTQAAGTQTALNVFTGTWRPVNSGVIEAMGISSTGNNQMSISYTSHCPPDQNLCFVNAQTFTFTGVPFNPTQLAAGGSAVQLLIVPSNNNQLLVTINASGETSLQTFTRRRFIDDIILDSVLDFQSEALTTTQFNQLRLMVTLEGP